MPHCVARDVRVVGRSGLEAPDSCEYRVLSYLLTLRIAITSIASRFALPILALPAAAIATTAIVMVVVLPIARAVIVSSIAAFLFAQ